MVEIASESHPGNWLDMCSGTGETALLLRKNANANTRVLAADYNESMIREFRRKPGSSSIPITLADAFSLPFRSGSLELVTTSFATRNLHQTREQLLLAFREFFRVISPGSHYISIESSRPKHLLIDTIFKICVLCLVEPLGWSMSGSRKGYAYLSRSIRHFYSPDLLSTILEEAGFQPVRYISLFMGAAAIHIATKPTL